ncbi:MAG TPA: hypothetical protein VD865_06500 [Stenotrophomonas sp.]|nr:hypothetical protein [Stenotrophomonas sp.]
MSASKANAMNRRLRWFGISFAALGLVAVLGAGVNIGFAEVRQRFVEALQSQPRVQGASRDSSSASRPASTGDGLEALIRARRVDPEVVRRLGGRAFEVSRPGGVRRGPRSGEQSLDYVKRLLPASQRGEAAATYDVWLAFFDCQNATSPDATASLPLMATAGIDPQREIERLTRVALACESLLTDPELSRVNWLERAAEQGSIEAMLVYAGAPDRILGSLANVLREPDRPRLVRERAMRYLEQAAAAGNVNALRKLSEAFKGGLLADRNLVRAYAYALASNRVNPLAPMPRVPGLPPFPDPDELLASQLSPTQRQEAKALADQIVAGCCR